MPKPYVPGPPDPRPNPLHSLRAEDAAPDITPRLTKSGSIDRRTAHAVQLAESLGPEGRSARGRAGMAARWGRYQIQTRSGGEWSTDGIGENPLRSLKECRGDVDALRGLIADDPSWATEYRIVRQDGEVVAYYDLTERTND